MKVRWKTQNFWDDTLLPIWNGFFTMRFDEIRTPRDTVICKTPLYIMILYWMFFRTRYWKKSWHTGSSKLKSVLLYPYFSYRSSVYWTRWSNRESGFTLWCRFREEETLVSMMKMLLQKPCLRDILEKI